MVSIIVAVAQNGIIGDRNSLLWHISEDMRFFRRTTSGHPVIMGRKTFESLGCRPLPGRDNIVITRSDAAYEGVVVAHSLDEAFAAVDSSDEAFIIGGAQIYAEAMPYADRLYITRIEHDFEGDTSFPDYDESQWRLISGERHDRGETFEYPFVFELYERIERPARQTSRIARAEQLRPGVYLWPMYRMALPQAESILRRTHRFSAPDAYCETPRNARTSTMACPQKADTPSRPEQAEHHFGKTGGRSTVQAAPRTIPEYFEILSIIFCASALSRLRSALRSA